VTGKHGSAKLIAVFLLLAVCCNSISSCAFAFAERATSAAKPCRCGALSSDDFPFPVPPGQLPSCCCCKCSSGNDGGCTCKAQPAPPFGKQVPAVLVSTQCIQKPVDYSSALDASIRCTELSAASFSGYQSVLRDFSSFCKLHLQPLKGTRAPPSMRSSVTK
jgi:hypothetical protein